jgi:hypothetical protein
MVGKIVDLDGNVIEEVDTTPTPELTFDEQTERAAVAFIDNRQEMLALAMVLADLIEKQFNVTQTVARQQVRSRFKGYMKELLDQQAGG